MRKIIKSLLNPRVLRTEVRGLISPPDFSPGVIVFFTFFIPPPFVQAVTYDSLRDMIQTNKVSSIEKLLPLLPDTYRSKYALLFNSRSLHGANFKEPRVLLYGEDAKLIISFNGSSNQKGFEALETMEFDETSKEFHFREILFPENSKTRSGPTFSQTNPEKCLKCHGNPPRPIWDTHPLWPGAYGERYHSPLSPSEKEGLASFLSQASTHPRYRQLAQIENFSNRETFYPSAQNRYNGTSKQSPNEELSRLLSEMNFKKIINEIIKSSQFSSYRYAILGTLHKDCGELQEFIPEAMRTIFLKQYEDFSIQTQERNQQQQSLKNGRAISLKYQKENKAEETESLNAFRFLVEKGLGISTEQWTTAMEVRTYDFTTPSLTSALLENLLLKRISGLDPTDSTIKKLTQLNQMSLSEPYCRFLKSQSKIELDTQNKTAPQTQSKWANANTPAAISPTPPPPPAPLKSCMECHKGEVASAIPFQDPQALAKLLNIKKYPRGTLLEEITYRLSRNAGADKMPRDANLSDSEQKNLEAYFKALSDLRRAPSVDAHPKKTVSRFNSDVAVE